MRWTRLAREVGEPQQANADVVVSLFGAMLTVVEAADGTTRWTTGTSDDRTILSSVDVDSDSVLVAVNTLPWMD